MWKSKESLNFRVRRALGDCLVQAIPKRYPDNNIPDKHPDLRDGVSYSWNNQGATVTGTKNTWRVVRYKTKFGNVVGDRDVGKSL